MARSITLIIRPGLPAAQLEELGAGVAALRAAGHLVRVRVAFEPGDVRRFARAAGLGGCEVVAAAGGDGTVNAVVNGLMAVERPVALAVVPLGTGNDFANELKLPNVPAEALAVAAEGRCVTVDVARVNRRCFINVSTGGFGAEATQATSRVVKRRLGRLAYVLRGARQLRRFRPARAKFRADGRVVHEGEFLFFGVGNGNRTGGGTRITPRADMSDGKLDLMVVGKVSRLELLALLPDLRAGTHLQSEHVRYFRAHEVIVECRGTVPVNADGEAVAGRTFRYDLLERPLNVLVPG